MGLFSCLTASKTAERVWNNTQYSPNKPRDNDVCTQTEVPDPTWLKEALATASAASGLAQDSLISARSMGKPGSLKESSGPTSVTLPDSPSCGQHMLVQSPDRSNADTLAVTSEDAQAEALEMMKAELKKMFLEFASFGTRGESKTMDLYRFTKVCRECDLLPRPKDTPSINLIFFKCKGTKSNKMTFGQFKSALRSIANQKNWELSTVHERIVQSEGPLVKNVTLTQSVKQVNTRASSFDPTPAKSFNANDSFMGQIESVSSMMGDLQLGRQHVMPHGEVPESLRDPQSPIASAQFTTDATVRRMRSYSAMGSGRRSVTPPPVGIWR